METMHTRLNIDPINKSLEKQARKVWQRVEETSPWDYEVLIHSEPVKSHGWWRQSLPLLTREDDPVYAQQSDNA